jgi:sulfide:quinone oxidoreductase
VSDGVPKILIVGSGPGALEATLALSASEYLPNAEISLISPQTEFVYRPNLVMEPFGVVNIARYSVGEIIAAEGVQQWLGTIDRIDAAAGKAWSPEDDEFEFDALIVATGTASNVELPAPAVTFGTPGSMDHLKELVHEIDAGAVRNVVFVAPEGPRWSLPVYELATMTAERAEHQANQQIAVAVVTPERGPLDIFGLANSEAIERLADELGVIVHTNATVLDWDGRTMTLANGAEYPVDRLFAMPRLSGIAPSGLPQDEHGFLPVDEFQRVLGGDAPLPGIFAVGDVTNFPLKQGGLATEAADTAVDAIEVQFGSREASEPFPREIEAILLTAGRRIPMRARVDADGSKVIPIEDLTGPQQKIRSRFLADRLSQISPLL